MTPPIDGVPREHTPGLFLQKLEKRVKDLELKSNARRKVALSSLVEGTTPTRVVAEQLTETVKEHLVVDGSNLAEDAVDGKRIVGAVIETDPEPDVGLKFTNEGMVAHGIGVEYDPVSQVSIRYNTRARLTSRTPGWASFPGDITPGLWFESTRQSLAGAPEPATPAGLTPNGAHSQGISMQSSQLTDLDYRTTVTADPNFVALVAQAARSAAGQAPDAQGLAQVNPGGWFLQGMRKGGVSTVSMSASTYDGTIRLEAPNGVLLNGAPIGSGGGSGSDSGWLTATYQNGWMDYGNGFGGLQYRKKDGVLYLRGSIKGGAFYTNVAQLPDGFRPVVPEGTSAMEFPITVIANNGTAFTAGTMFAYATGTLTYYSPPSTWVGPDRVIINNAFPL